MPEELLSVERLEDGLQAMRLRSQGRLAWCNTFINEELAFACRNTYAATAAIHTLITDLDPRRVSLVRSNPLAQEKLTEVIRAVSPVSFMEKFGKLNQQQAQELIRLMLVTPAVHQSNEQLVRLCIRTHAATLLSMQPDTIPQESIPLLIPEILQPDALSFAEDESLAISQAVQLRGWAERLLQSLVFARQQELLPVFVRHCCDVDFLDKAEAYRYASLIADESEREASLAYIAEYATGVPRTANAVRAQFTSQAAENGMRLSRELREKYGDRQMDQVLAAVQPDFFATLNCKPAVLGDILRSGTIKSNWDTIGRYQKDISSFYDLEAAKDATERFLGIRGKGTRADPHPIYTACGSSEAEIVHGAAPQYGQCHIKIRPSKVRESALFIYGDSMMNLDTEELREQLKGRILDYEGVRLGKAKLALDSEEKKRFGYVEAIFPQGLTMDDIDEIVIPRALFAGLGLSPDRIRELYPDVRLVLT